VTLMTCWNMSGISPRGRRRTAAAWQCTGAVSMRCQVSATNSPRRTGTPERSIAAGTGVPARQQLDEAVDDGAVGAGLAHAQQVELEGLMKPPRSSSLSSTARCR